MTLTKADLIDRIHKSTELKKIQSVSAVETVLATIKNSLELLGIEAPEKM